MRRKPDLEDLELMFWQAFKELDDSRDGDAAFSPDDVRQWCEIHGYRDEETILDYWDVIRRVDLRRRELDSEKIKNRTR